MAELIKTTFSDWTQDQLRKTFSLQRSYQSLVLKEWIADASSILCSDFETQALQKINDHAQWGIDEWSEEEIKQEILYRSIKHSILF